ncbi:OLC1v1018949C1 [Oldenlandia corymbosa var. corymbosa]|uniref:OLC1v1018949C1 n=1 Tax=Oldenlandia corymbosa var. corymbosa TaxID=529605 RepID=A0AAV1ECU1_OLDCO|nr:OLC1v1018949C1 [Oldenlandia corymbosa var. corymbosa]
MTSNLSSSLVSLLLLLLSLSSINIITAARPPQQPVAGNATGLIGESCKASRDTSACVTTLSQSGVVPDPKNATLLSIIQLATQASSKNLTAATVSSLLDAAMAAKDVNLTTAAKGCLEGLINAQQRTNATIDALTRGRMKDARSWLSAALSYESGCPSGLANVKQDSATNATVATLNSLAGLTSNALAMLVNYDNFGDKPGSWSPVQTERNGFWERVDGSGSKLGSAFPAGYPVGW